MPAARRAAESKDARGLRRGPNETEYMILLNSLDSLDRAPDSEMRGEVDEDTEPQELSSKQVVP